MLSGMLWQMCRKRKALLLYLFVKAYKTCSGTTAAWPSEAFDSQKHKPKFSIFNSRVPCLSIPGILWQQGSLRSGSRGSFTGSRWLDFVQYPVWSIATSSTTIPTIQKFRPTCCALKQSFGVLVSSVELSLAETQNVATLVHLR